MPTLSAADSGGVPEKRRNRYRQAFVEIIFMRLRSETIRSLHPFGRALLYALAFVVFYLPIGYYAVASCLDTPGNIPYFAAMAAMHVLAKVMLCGSKRIRQRFSTLRSKKHFLMRSWLIIEYVVFMWLVFLIYPLVCLLFPFSLLFMAYERLLGFTFIIDLFTWHMETFILIGGILSYIAFIVADGHKRLKKGSMPEYLSIYALLTVVSGTMESATQQLLEGIPMDAGGFMMALSQLFRISNDAMKLVASALTIYFATTSLYAVRSGDAQPAPEVQAMEEASADGAEASMVSPAEEQGEA